MKDVMYRSEETGGSGVRNIIDIMIFEIYELGNTDILDYVLETYLKDTDMRELLKNIIDDVSAYSINEIEEVCEDIIQEINAQTGHNLKYALWLADYNVVAEIYSFDDSTIEAYKTSDIILSDLGRDGILFAYDKEPMPIQ